MHPTSRSILTQEKVSLELRFVRSGDRDDAAQEAMLAHLEGRDPAKAVSAFRHRERRRRLREIVNGDLVTGALASVASASTGRAVCA